jgi:predicted TPR repeat methyltransferase
MAGFISNTLRIGPEDMVIDLGCGTGLITNEVADRASSVLALDYSEIALRVAREKRQRGNVSYEWADLNTIDLTRLRTANKVYSVGSMLYLDSRDVVFRIVDALVENHIEALLIDLPDETLVDNRKRNYDTSEYPHQKFVESEFSQRYPDANVSIHRKLFPYYVNDSLRFTVHIQPL